MKAVARRFLLRTERHMIARYGWSRRIWSVRRRAISARGRAEGVGFRVTKLRRGAGETYRAVRSVGARILGSIAFAASIVGLVWLVDSHIGYTQTLSSTSYDTLFEALAGVSGVFLALYFTAVSTVASTAYADVPSEVRNLLVRDKLSNSYVVIVAFLTALSIGFLGLRALGYEPLALAVWVALAAAGLAIFAFLALGLRAFQFFDPVALANLALSDLLTSAHRAVAFKRPASAHTVRDARRSVQASILAVTSLISLARGQRRFRGRGVPNLLKQVAQAARAYSFLKTGIPTDGGWFGTRYRHRRWYLSDYRAGLETATHAFVGLQPEEVPDTSWVEDALTELLGETLKDLLKEEDFEAVWSVGPILQEYISSQAAVFAVRETSAWVESLGDAIVAARAPESPSQRESAIRTACTEWVGRALLELEVAVYRRIDGLDVQSLDRALTTADYADPGTPARLSSSWGLPRTVTETLEMVQSGRKFEEVADVGVTTPNWYARDLLVNRLRWAIHDDWNAAVDINLRATPRYLEQLHTSGRPIEAAALCMSAMETAWKIKRHVPAIRARDDALRQLMVLTDLSEPTWDWDTLAQSAEQFQKDTLATLARLIPDLASTEDLDEFPDFLGQAVHFTGEACFSALAAGDAEQFNRLFPPYFFGVLGVAQRVGEQVVSWPRDRAAPWIAAPVIDLLAISGHSMIYSALRGDPALWNGCRSVWNRYLESQSTERLTFLDALVAIERGSFSLHPRGVLRTRWEMQLEHDLRELPRKPTDEPFDDGEIDHPSALIRRLMPVSWHTSYQALDIFVVLYLGSKPGADGLDFGARGAQIDHLDRLGDLRPLFEPAADESKTEVTGFNPLGESGPQAEGDQ